MSTGTTLVVAALLVSATHSSSINAQPQPQLQAASSPSLRVVESFDLTQFAGTWYEIARLPDGGQRRCARDVVTRYVRREDGRIDVVNSCRGEDGKPIDSHRVARVVGNATSSPRLSIRTTPALLSWLQGAWRDYWIIGRGPEYSWAVAGTPTREGLWILARTADMSASSYEQALQIAKGNGFDVSQLIKTRHTAR
jgi:apolipoprotein D and lipocalin family protein